MKFFSDDPRSVLDPREMVSFFSSGFRDRDESLSLKGLALITFTSKDLNELTADGSIRKKESWKHRNNRIYEGDGWVVVQSPFGAPNAAMLLEEVIAFGVTRAVYLGYCGSLGGGVEIGEVVLPIEALREEGTSYHYLREGERSVPDRDLQEELFESMRQGGMRAHRGKIWTTDAPYRETLKKVIRYRSEGVLGVDMEMSAVFAVGMARHVSIGSVLLVSDVLKETDWEIGFHSPRLKAGREKVIGILLGHLRKMVP